MCTNKIRVNPCQSALFTSQCGREQEVGSVFSDNVVSDGAETGPPAQLPNGLEELGVQRQGKAIVLLSLQGQAVHLPAAKLPAMSHKQKLSGGKQHMNAACRHVCFYTSWTKAIRKLTHCKWSVIVRSERDLKAVMGHFHWKHNPKTKSNKLDWTLVFSSWKERKGGPLLWF